MELKTNGITVNAASRVILNASAVEVNAGPVSVSATVSKFSGVVQCDTLISNSVVSQNYSPGGKCLVMNESSNGNGATQARRQRYFVASPRPGRSASQFPATARATPSAAIHVQR